MRRRPPSTITALVAFHFLVAVACGGGDSAQAECTDPQTTTNVTMGDFFYEPRCVEAPAGTELDIENEGDAPHTFTVEADGAQAAVDVPAGDRATLTVPGVPAGTYRVTCTYHPQMEAALRIA
jgi:plastocyanin